MDRRQPTTPESAPANPTPPPRQSFVEYVTYEQLAEEQRAAEPEREVFSSLWTPVQKFIFPLLWMCLLGYFGITYWRGDLQIEGYEGTPLSLGVVVLAAIVATALIAVYSGYLRCVIREGDELLISDYFQEVRVPLSAVTQVKCWRWSKGKEIILYFDQKTPLGSKAFFLPKLEWFVFGWSEHPLAEEIRSLVRSSQYDGSGGRWVDRHRSSKK